MYLNAIHAGPIEGSGPANVDASPLTAAGGCRGSDRQQQGQEREETRVQANTTTTTTTTSTTGLALEQLAVRARRWARKTAVHMFPPHCGRYVRGWAPEYIEQVLGGTVLTDNDYNMVEAVCTCAPHLLQCYRRDSEELV